MVPQLRARIWCATAIVITLPLILPAWSRAEDKPPLPSPATNGAIQDLQPKPLTQKGSSKSEHQPLFAGITLDLNNVDEQEKIPRVLSPLMLDATSENKLSLDKVLEIAARKNLAYLRSRWLGKKATLAFLGSTAAMNPFFIGKSAQDFSVTVSPNFQGGQLFPQNQPLDRLRYTTYGATLSNGGTAFLTMLTSLFQARAQAASVKQSLQDTLFEATNNYLELCKEISLVKTADIIVRNSKGIVDLNEALVSSGMGTRLQLLQAETQFAEDRQQLVLQQLRARVAALKLSVTLNLPLTNYILPAATALDKMTLVDPNWTPENLEQQALAQRPELVVKRNIIRERFAQSAQALTPLVPTASYAVQQGSFFPSNGAGNISGIQRGLQLSWQLNSLALPVLPNMGAGLAAARAAEYDLSDTALHIRSEVRESYDSCLAQEANIAIAYKATLSAQEQLKIAETRLKTGIGVNIDVIQAQTALSNALRNYVRAVYDYDIQQAKLRRAIGGFSYTSVMKRLRYN